MEQGVIRYIHDTMTVGSIEAFGSIRGSCHGGQKEVCFVRALGMGAGYRESVQRLDSAMRTGRVAYQRLSALPGMPSKEAADCYAGCFEKWLDSQRGSLETTAAQEGAGLSKMLGSALAAALEQYRRVKPALSQTMEKNLAVKLMYWTDTVLESFSRQDMDIAWDGQSNVKLVVHNVAKEQEYLFCYMLTQAGIDVLLLQNRADVQADPQLKRLSAELLLGSYGEFEIPEFSQDAAEPVHISNGQMDRKRSDIVMDGGKIRMVIPERPGRKRTQPAPPPVPIQRPQRVQMPQRSQAQQGRQQSAARAEKSFEQLALLASSVVMIAVHDDKGNVIGTGSGIMIGKKGYILTNSHVASGGRYYTVMIEDDSHQYRTSEIVKYNNVLDLAVLKIDRTLCPLPVYKGSQKLVRGQRVVAIGSPLGLFNSVSDGIISGFRVIDNVDMIQFTAPTSHGSSGGAVLNMYGEVIGISTSGFDDAQNINLAVGYGSINMFVQGFV